ncbi:MAG: dehydrogenase, partial [Chitinophagaceae bacterium]|nr:dehydrogenase [Chitinophagaceae bacterium]
MLLFSACRQAPPKAVCAAIDPVASRKSVSPAPVLTARESISKMKVEPGLEVKEVASEPVVIAPVAMAFDDKGRMWVAEMQGYMPDTTGKGENEPRGKIAILEDTNHDGMMDTRKIFLDKLVMPRALCLIDNGLLYAEPPNLWFVPIHNLQAGKKLLVDSAYAEGGNPEHQPNGLMRAIDNWIYSANCKKRYRKKGTRWLIEPALARGQWGISQDNYGRLFYNNNSENLLGDYYSPAFGKEDSAGFNENIVSDNNVFPAHPTPGVNRGYIKGILDDSLRLRNFTAASGPVIYRGGLFGKNYEQNAFVGEPSANLVKRDILMDSGYKVTGRQAYHGKEFLASTDERFRPVTLYNGPDGALYVLDMYRGIIQHKTYLTDYLKKEIRSRELSSPLTCGRIYKVVPEISRDTVVDFPSDPAGLVQLLDHPSGWVRDKAQQLLIDGKCRQAVPLLRNNLQLAGSPLTVVHSLWTLEGLGQLTVKDLFPLINNSSPQVRVQALTAVASLINKKNRSELLQKVGELIDRKDSLSVVYTGFLNRDNTLPKNTGISEKNRLVFPEGFKLFNTICKTCHGEDGNGI